MKIKLQELVNPKSIMSSSIIYAISVAMGQFVSIITLPLVLRTLTVEEYGQYGLYSSVISLLASIAGLSIGNAVLRFGAQYDSKSEKLYDLIINSLLIVVSFGGAVLFTTTICSIIGKSIVLFYIGLISFLTALNKMTQNYLRVKNQVGIILIQSSVYLLLYGLGVVVAYYSNRLSIVTLFWIQIISFSFSILYGLMKSFRKKVHFVHKKTIKFNRSLIVMMLSFSIPLLASGLIELVLQNLDIWMLEWLSTSQDVGNYNFIKRFNHIVDFIKNSFFMAWPYFAYKYINQQRHKKMFNILIGLMTFMIGFILLGVHYIVVFFGGLNYVDTINSVGITCIISLLAAACTFIDTSASISTKTIYITICSAIGVIADFIMNYCFIPRWGYIGATIATFLSYLVLIMARIIIYKQKGFFITWTKVGLSIIVLSSVLVLIKSLCFSSMSYAPIGIILIFSSGLILLYEYREKISNKMEE